MKVSLQMLSYLLVSPATGSQSSATTRPPFNYALEALRGIAALMVVWYHFICHKGQVDPAFDPVGIGAYQAPGHFAVLVFFVLSGYVIGLAHRQAMMASDVLLYLRKRFTRIYPMYVLALLAGFAVSPFSHSSATIGWHLVFGINGLPAPTIFANNPLWSLQYEVLFYLLFVPLSMLKARPAWVASCSVLLAFLCLIADPTGAGQYASPYLFGFGIWSVGWALAGWQPVLGTIHYTQLVSAVLLFASINVFNVLTSVGQKILDLAAQHPMGPLDVARWPFAYLAPLDLMALPYAVVVVGQFLHFRGRLWRIALTVLQLLPLYTFTFLLAHRHEPGAGIWLLPTACYVVSTILFFWPSNGLVENTCQKLVKRMVPFGAISYGIYVIHFPIMTVFHRTPFFSGTPFTFAVRAVFILGLTIAAAYWMEKVFQPWAKRLLSPVLKQPQPVRGVLNK